MSAYDQIGHGLAPIERAILVKNYPAAEVTPGATVRVLFGDIPRRDQKNRFGNLVGFRIQVTLRVDTNATTMGAAMPGEDLFGQLQNFRLRAGGVDYMDGSVDGRALRFDTILRHGKVLIADPSDVPDATDTDVDNTIDLVYRFASAYDRSRLDGAIPLALLDHRQDADDVLSFQLDGSASGAVKSTYGGVLLDGTTPYADLSVYALVRYEERPIAMPGWHLSQLTTTEIQGSIGPVPGTATRLAYAYVTQYYEDDTSGAYSDFGNWTVIQGGDVIAAARSVTEMQEAEQLFRAQGATVSEPSDFTHSGRIALAPTYPGLPWSEMGRAPIEWSVSTKGSNWDRIRVTHRQIRPLTETQRARLAARWGFDPNNMVRVAPASRDITPELLPQVFAPKSGPAPVRR